MTLLLSISSAWQQKKYSVKQILIHADDEVSRFYYINKGYIKVFTINDEGEEHILLILKPGDLFPLLKNPSQSGQESLYFYSAMVEVDLYVIDQQLLIDKLKDNLEASWQLLRYVSEFSYTLTNRLAQLESSKKADDKLASLFNYLISVCGQPTKLNYYLLDLKLTHQDIARLIGVTRETVSVAMKRLENQNKIMTRRGYLLISGKYASGS